MPRSAGTTSELVFVRRTDAIETTRDPSARAGIICSAYENAKSALPAASCASAPDGSGSTISTSRPASA